MIDLRAVALLALVFTCWPGAMSPADAKIGDNLARSQQAARVHKKDLMGVTYWLDGRGQVVRESWNSEKNGWDVAMADRFRQIVVGKRKLKTQKITPRTSTFTFVDGTVALYHKRNEKLVLVIDFISPACKADKLAAGSYKEVQDWKERPWKGKAW